MMDAILVSASDLGMGACSMAHALLQGANHYAGRRWLSHHSKYHGGAVEDCMRQLMAFAKR